MLPLGAPAQKPWGKSNMGFPCCWGTLTEQFSKLTDSIYFSSPDHSTIFVQQVKDVPSRTMYRTAPCVSDSVSHEPLT
jgi:DUF1680 family protein